MRGKHNRKREPLDPKGLAANGLVALAVGTLLIIIDKYLI